ncbi:MAG: hypothetical protein J6Y28_09875 [Acholeplasmatales bacterium]|nr:hypothetical protein [Acholeplasmatales bacterium]
MINYIPHEISRLGLDKFLHLSIASLNASKVWEDGLRPIQTISYIYVRAITEIVYTINTYVDESDRDTWFNNLLTQHKANLEFEKTTPPVDYDACKPKAKSKSGTTKQSTPRREKNNIEPTAKEIKLANKVAKLNLLKFNIK